jgi:hypothetical protein
LALGKLGCVSGPAAPSRSLVAGVSSRFDGEGSALGNFGIVCPGDTPLQKRPFEFIILAPQTLETRWFATSGTGNRFGNPSDSGSIYRCRDGLQAEHSTSRSFPSLARSPRVTGRSGGGDRRRLLASLSLQLNKFRQPDAPHSAAFAICSCARSRVCVGGYSPTGRIALARWG